MKLRLTLSYDGTGFQGWARQPGRRTVEGVLRTALETCYPGWEDLAVAGRTDTGVHALAQVVSVAVDVGPPPPAAAVALNAALPDDVAVTSAQVAPEDFSARHSAVARAYLYRVRTERIRDPLAAHRVLHHPRPVDRAVLDAWCAALLGTHDFTAFTPRETQHRYFTRTVHHAAWHDAGPELRFTIAADGFLRHQVRALVGTMLQAACGRPIGAPSDLLAGAPRSAAGVTAPAHGLYLAGVRFAGEPEGSELVGIL